MSIRFRKDRNKYELSISVEGKRKRLLFDTKREASEFGAKPAKFENSIIIDEAIQIYYRDVSSGKSNTSRKNEKRYFNLMDHFLVEERGLDCLKAVRYGDMVALQNWFLQPRVYDDKPMKWSASTVNRAFNSIKDFFVYWVRDGELESSPCAHLETLSAEENSRRSITGDEFLQAFSKAKDWYKPAMAFMHLTGSAPSSLARFKWEHVDYTTSHVTITRMKGGWREFLFPMSIELRTLLLAQFREKHGFVFSNEHGKPLSAEWCSKVGNRAIKKAKLKGVVLYSMRHALASELTDANVSMEIIRQLMGHANIRTTQRYAKPKTESLAHALTLVRSEKCHQTATKDIDEVCESDELIAAGEG